MRFIHTSDWHLGRQLYGKKRYEEMGTFLGWLLDTIEDKKAQALLIAGDIFDTSTPSNHAQQLYYRFLAQVSKTCCEHVVITSGNHDSPSFLQAPKELLRYMNVHLSAVASQDPADEVLVLGGQDKKPQMIVCAVPYLRDRDVRTVEAGEQVQDKDQKRLGGIARHYASVCEHAQKIAEGLGSKIPIVAMGHLFTTGGTTTDGDGVRELYVGSLSRVRAELFPENIDYLALGHLHQPQLVEGAELRRYSGSPIPMGFSEAKTQKVVLCVDAGEQGIEVEPIPVPRFQKLETVKGDLEEITEGIKTLIKQDASIWLQVVYDGEEIHGSLSRKFHDMVLDSQVEILRVKDPRFTESVLKSTSKFQTLEELDPPTVFARCLDAMHVPQEQRKELNRSYSEILEAIWEQEPAEQ